MAGKCRRKMVNKVKRSLDSPKMFLYFFQPRGVGQERRNGKAKSGM